MHVQRVKMCVSSTQQARRTMLAFQKLACLGGHMYNTTIYTHASDDLRSCLLLHMHTPTYPARLYTHTGRTLKMLQPLLPLPPLTVEWKGGRATRVSVTNCATVQPSPRCPSWL